MGRSQKPSGVAKNQTKEGTSSVVAKTGRSSVGSNGDPKTQSVTFLESPEEPSTSSAPMETTYDAEGITGRRMKEGKVQYLVKWVGFPKSQSTWEPLENIGDCHEMIAAYEEGLDKRRQRRSGAMSSSARRSTSEKNGTRNGTPIKAGPEKRTLLVKSPGMKGTPAKLGSSSPKMSPSRHAELLQKKNAAKSKLNSLLHKKTPEVTVITHVNGVSPVVTIITAEPEPAPTSEPRKIIDLPREPGSSQRCSPRRAFFRPTLSIPSGSQEEESKTRDQETSADFVDLAAGSVPVVELKPAADAELIRDLRRISSEVVKIVGMTRVTGETDMHVVIHFKESPTWVTTFPLRVVRHVIPGKLMEYYEGILTFG